MIKTTVCKTFDFPAAHKNLHHVGRCQNLHGHTWRLDIMVRGRRIADESREDYGMVVDFGDIKAAYEEHVEPFVEHQFLNETLNLPEYTTELIAQWIYDTLQPHLHHLHKVRLWEGQTSWAEVGPCV